MVVRKKKQKKVEQGGGILPFEGDAWTYAILKRNSYLFVSFAVGKRTKETCKKMMKTFAHRVRLPTPSEPLEIYSDGNDDYTTTLLEYYPKRCLKYGQLIKIKKKGRLVEKLKRTVFGDVDHKDIETTDIENFNGILRGRNGRLVRKTKCYSKEKPKLERSIELLQFYWNLMWELKDKKTPAMLENLVNRRWLWDDFFKFRLSIVN